MSETDRDQADLKPIPGEEPAEPSGVSVLLVILDILGAILQGISMR